MDQFIADFHFVRPLWLMAFLPAIALIIVLLRQKSKQGQWHQFLPAHLAKVLIETSSPSRQAGSSALIIIASLLISIALAGPTWQRVEQPLFKVKQAQVIIADMSLSMFATDVLPNRLTRAKFKIKDLVSRLSEGETALIAYAGDAFVISPMTQDVANLQNLIPSLSPEIMPVYGSRPSWAIEKALELLKQTNYKQGTLYLITDGLEPSDAREITRLLKNTQFTLNILGIGTLQGAPIKLPNGQLLKNDSGNIVLPKLQSNILRGLSNTLSGRYSNLTNDQADIDYVTNNVAADELDNDQQDNQFGDEWHEVGPYILLILLPFAAYAFRRGIITIIAMTVMIYPLASSDVMADESASLPKVQSTPMAKPIHGQPAPTQQSSWWDNLWQTKNQQGLTSYKNKDFSNASSQFKDPQWRGTAHYKQGNFEQALEHFNQSKKPQGLYNQANTLAKLGQLDESIDRYKQLLKQDPSFPNAQDNLDLVTKLAKQKKQQQNKDEQKNNEQGDKKQDQDKQQGDEKKDGDSSKQDKKQQGEQNPNDDKKGDQQDPDSQSQKQSQQQKDDATESKEQQNGDKKQPLSDQEKQKMAKQQKDANQKQQMFNKDNLTPEELQRLNRLVKKIPDDPSLLLKNKMALEARKRQHQRVTTKERKKW